MKYTHYIYKYLSREGVSVARIIKLGERTVHGLILSDSKPDRVGQEDCWTFNLGELKLLTESEFNEFYKNNIDLFL